MRPGTIDEAREALAALGRAGRPVAIRGGATKPWAPRPGAATLLDTRGLSRIVEHNVGDQTAVLEGGVALADAQAVFAAHGQMLALDPPLGKGQGATIGGVIASRDSGPLRHRYGAARDLVVGMTVVLTDGSCSKSGGKVIKNVAGYDVAKLFAGSMGTLGLIASVTVRLHPLSARRSTTVAATGDATLLAATALAAARLPLEAECLDVTWSAGHGRLLVRFAGVACGDRAMAAAETFSAAGFADVEHDDDDEPRWDAQRSAQRGPLVLKVSARPAQLPRVLEVAARHDLRVVSRVALGLSWLVGDRPDAATVREVRDALAPAAVVVLDGASALGACAYATADPVAASVMTRLKQRFDPAGVLGSLPIQEPG